MTMRRRHREGPVHPDDGAAQAAEADESAQSEATGLTPEVTIVGRGAEFVGTLVSAESIRVDGHVRGRMAARADVTLSSDSVVEADILAENVVVGGALKGSITARARAELTEGSRLEGGIRSKLLVVKEGAVFSGQSSTGENATSASDGHPSDELQTAYDQAKQRATNWYKTRLDSSASPQPQRDGETAPVVADQTTPAHVTARRAFPHPAPARTNDPWPDENGRDDWTPTRHEQGAGVDR
jgi:cytoskeletal protein CcmA (bactofilin family)